MSGSYLARDQEQEHHRRVAAFAYAILWVAGIWAAFMVYMQHETSTNYVVNGLIEYIGANALLLNVLKLYRQKMSRGVHWVGTAFFMTWGYWNIYYYPSVGDHWSFAGGLFVVAVNTFWLGQMFYYRKN